ncbi:MAG: hypothetical protein NTZ24_13295 [Deltaproteobacteria bacterium]|nr:hypothetical protein [Deltaproteobacteria bacterium]
MDAEIVVHTGLNAFTVLDRIEGISASHITGSRSFSDAPVYLGLEALAQLGAFYIRHLVGFNRHVFLLKIVNCSLPSPHILKGEYSLSGRLLSRSASAFSCRLKAGKGNTGVMEGDFLYASIDYDGNFKKDILQRYYRKMFACLHSDLKRG